MDNEKKKKSNNLFVIILFVIVIVFVLFFPKLYSFIEKAKLPEVPKTQTEDDNEEKVVTDELLEELHYPIMRNSIYDSNTYYTLDKFTISNMSNSDILYNAFMDMYEGNITKSNSYSRCSNTPMEFNDYYIEFRIVNILGKNVKYTLDSFYVPEDSNSSYKGNWRYDNLNSKFIYDGLCSSKASNTTYYDLTSLIKSEYDGKDIVVYYYVGFAKVVNNNYTIYKDAKMTEELKNGTINSVDELNSIFESINNRDKKIYKYTFKNTLCKYDEYCLYKGEYVNEL